MNVEKKKTKLILYNFIKPITENETYTNVMYIIDECFHLYKVV